MKGEQLEVNRIDYIDVFRGFGILLMVIDHIGMGYKFSYFVHAFHMPMFFFLSGFFFKMPKYGGGFIRKKMRSLLLPYFFFGSCFYFVWLTYNKFSLRLFYCLYGCVQVVICQ